MLWAVWVALGFAALVVGLGAYRAVRELLRALRALRDLQSRTLGAFESLTRSAEQLARHPDPTGKLEPALASFNRSHAQLSVLLAAVGDVRDSVGRVTSFYPRK